jgi:hypothetical protein
MSKSSKTAMRRRDSNAGAFSTERRDSKVVRERVLKPGHGDARESGDKDSRASPKSSTSIRNASKTYAKALERLAKR